MTPEALSGIVARFAGRRVVLCGDLVVDEYIYGRTQRISREAPVLVVRYDERELRPGCGANAAANLAALGARVSAVGLVGRDALGEDLRRLLREVGIGVAGVLASPGRVTACKTRILAGDLHTSRQQMLRIDRESGVPPGPRVETALRRQLERALRGADGLLLSDYGDGAVSAGLVALAVRAARRGVTVCADSRHNIGDYRGIPWVTPNEPEAAQACGLPIESPEDVRRAARRLLRLTRGQGVLITRGAQGLAVFERGRRPVFLPPFGGVEVADVTGAGDTVAAVFLLAMASGATPVAAAILANLGGGLVVAKRGTATISLDELLAAVAQWAPGEGRR
jgi:rfaE bifunctional protein kinase chain/domain